MNTIQRTRNAVSAFRQPTQAFRVLALCAFLALGSLCGSVQAAVPQTINYQGYLTNPGGTPVNATMSMVLKLYNASTGGAALYTETQTVPVANGVFNVLIGSVMALALPFDVQYYLGVTVGGDPEMMPRQPLAAAPYAIRAAIPETPRCFDANNRYKDCGDGTVYDKTTGLMWEKKTACGVVTDPHCVLNTYSWTVSVVPYTEPTGTLYSDFLERLNDLKTPNDGTATPCFAGYCDWRIPTIGELRSILLAPSPGCPATPCIDAIFGPTQATSQPFDYLAASYWSSSSLLSDPTRAWFVGFHSGSVGSIFKTWSYENDGFYARAVRSGR